jgi:glycosyltransferase involved in cell wall biosynthesis
MGSGPVGTAKYEEMLFKELSKQNEINTMRIKRRENGVRGSMPLSWLLRYRAINAKIVHATFQTVAPAALLHRPENLVVTVHDLAPLIYTSEVRDLSLRLQWSLTPRSLRVADRIIAISKFTKNEIRRLLDIPESKIDVVHQGVDHELYQPHSRERARKRMGLDEETPYILVVSSGLEHKRIKEVKPIIERVREEYPEAKLLKAGYAEKLSGEYINNTGWVSEEDMPYLYNAADVYLHPSEYEGFGLPILEAMACGTPVVARNVASIPEVVGDETDLVPHDASVQTFADRIIEQIPRNPPLPELVDRSHKFSWGKSAIMTKKVYESMLE